MNPINVLMFDSELLVILTDHFHDVFFNLSV